MRLKVHVKPRASRNALVGYKDGVLDVALCAPPVDGEANEALVVFLAKALGLKRRQVSLAAGERSRNKSVELEGLDEAQLLRQLEA